MMRLHRNTKKKKHRIKGVPGPKWEMNSEHKLFTPERPGFSIQHC